MYIVLFCVAMKCPVYSHYELCANGCPTSCMSLVSPIACNSNCKEGCSCDDGYVLSGDVCVPMSRCGCLYNDYYYQSGQVFYPNGQCQEQCKCTKDGEVMDTQVYLSALEMYLLNICSIGDYFLRLNARSSNVDQMRSVR